jgi:hypothetical protein
MVNLNSRRAGINTEVMTRGRKQPRQLHFSFIATDFTPLFGLCGTDQ